MGIYDRDYSQEKYRSYYDRRPPMRFRFAPVTPMVKNLLIINIAVFFAGILIKPLNLIFYQWFSVYPVSFGNVLQPWRIITYQFLHGSIWHLLPNMIGLFFLGPVLERHWGGKKFLTFYLSCGAVGGLLYPLLLWMKVISPHPAVGVLPLVGASGAILGMLAACAILFPQFVVFAFFFPVPIRIAAVIVTLVAVAGIITGDNAGGEAAHLAGMAAGAVYVLFKPWREKLRSKTNVGGWERKITESRNLQAEVDRILEKVHNQGVASLTRRERKILEEATRREQRRNKL